MNDSPAYHLDIGGVEEQSRRGAGSEGLKGRPWVGVRFDCCGTYNRIYRNAEGTAYRGRCPRCGRAVTMKVGPGGTSSRFFVAE